MDRVSSRNSGAQSPTVILLFHRPCNLDILIINALIQMTIRSHLDEMESIIRALVNLRVAFAKRHLTSDKCDYTRNPRREPRNSYHLSFLTFSFSLFFLSFLLWSDSRSEGSIAIVKIFDFHFFMIFDSTSLPHSKNVNFLQPFRHFTYVRAHSPTLPSLYLRHSSFSNPCVPSPKSQFILRPFFCFSYITSSSLNSPGEPPMFCSP